MGLILKLVHAPPIFLPGEEVVGTVEWSGVSGQKQLAVHLLWFTSVKGTRDVGKTDQVVVERPARDGERAFVLRLPAAPYSFSGKLITLAWAVEASLLPSGERVRAELVMSPTRAELGRSGQAPAASEQ